MKKVIALIIAIALAITATLAVNVATTAAAQSGEYKKGHILGNDTLTTADALEILKYLVGADGAIWTAEDGYNATALAAATIVSDDKPATADALEILKAIVGIDAVLAYTDGIHNSLTGSKTLALFRELEKGIFTCKFVDANGAEVVMYHGNSNVYMQHGNRAVFMSYIEGTSWLFDHGSARLYEWSGVGFPPPLLWVEFGCAVKALEDVRFVSGSFLMDSNGIVTYREELIVGGESVTVRFNQAGEVIWQGSVERREAFFVSPTLPDDAFDMSRFLQEYTRVGSVEELWG